jgi:hypothetical protein
MAYIGTTAGAVLLVLGVFYGIVRMSYASHEPIGRRTGRVLVGIACGLAYGTVVATTWALKRFYGHKFGSYLDDADAEEPDRRPKHGKLCARCGMLFQVCPNDAHQNGFCSHSCWEAFLKSR